MRHGPGLIPDPDVQLFETWFRVRFHEVDALGHVNNAAYLNYLEQAAIDHATFLGLTLERLRDLGGVFVAGRHDIVFVRPAYAGDLLRIVTWLGEVRGARVERQYLISRELEKTPSVPVTGRVIQAADLPFGDAIVVRAMTEWVFAGNRGQPRRIPSQVQELFEFTI